MWLLMLMMMPLVAIVDLYTATSRIISRGIQAMVMMVIVIVTCAMRVIVMVVVILATGFLGFSMVILMN